MRKVLFSFIVLATACGGEEFLSENAPGPIEKEIAAPTDGPQREVIEPNWAELRTMLPKIIVAEPTADDIRNAPDEPCGGVCTDGSVCDEAINACVATHGAMVEYFAPGACINPELEIDLVRSATQTYDSNEAYDIELLDMTFTPRPATIVSRIVMLSTDWNVLSGGLELRDRYYGELARANDEGQLQNFRMEQQSLFSEQRRLRVHANNLYSPRTNRQELVLYAVHAVNPRTGLPAKVCFRRPIYAEFRVAPPNPCSQNDPRHGYPPLAWMQKVAPGTREYKRFTTNTSSVAIMDAEVTACEDMDLHGLPMLFRGLSCDTDYTDPLLTDAGLFTLNGPLFSGLRIRTGTVTFATDTLDPMQQLPGFGPGAADCHNRLAFRGSSVIRMIRGETRRFSLGGNIGQRAMRPDYYHTQFKVEYDSARLTAQRVSDGAFRPILNLTAHQSVQVLD